MPKSKDFPPKDNLLKKAALMENISEIHEVHRYQSKDLAALVPQIILHSNQSTRDIASVQSIGDAQ